ncbi:MAG: NAD(P)-dependent oxidoreductase, partial [Chloroflexota bacterium]
MNILITGAQGQLGLALQSELKDHEIIGVDLPTHDISDKKMVNSLIGDNKPDILLNCAAYTNVDGSAKDPATAYKANALGPQNLALACLEHGTPMVHVSTNEVFDGSDPAGYEEWMPLHPINPYGKSKAAGEFNVRSILPQHFIVRTAWLYASSGRNFIHAIMNRAKDSGKVRVVTDEIGNPTWAKDLAAA